VRHAVETKLDTVMDSRQRASATHAGFLEEVGNAVFDDARSNPLLHVVEAPGFQDDGVDASRWRRWRARAPPDRRR